MAGSADGDRKRHRVRYAPWFDAVALETWKPPNDLLIRVQLALGENIDGATADELTQLVRVLVMQNRLAGVRPRTGPELEKLARIRSLANELATEIGGSGSALDVIDQQLDRLRATFPKTGVPLRLQLSQDLGWFWSAIAHVQEAGIVPQDQSIPRQLSIVKLILELADWYENKMGRRAGVSTDPITGEPGGPFYRLVTVVVNIAPDDFWRNGRLPTELGLRQSIKRTMTLRRGRTARDIPGHQDS